MVQFSFRFVGGGGASGFVSPQCFLLYHHAPHFLCGRKRKCAHVWFGGSGNTALYSDILTKHPVNNQDDGEALKTATCFLLFKEKCLKPGEVTQIWNTL